MPRPSRSTLMSPRSAQSSLSHWTTLRPGMAAGSSGTTSSSRPAAITVAAVDVLDDLFSPVTTREVEVDVRPLAALLGEEALEEEVHADRIDGRDAERVADGAVGRRAASLTEDAALAGEADDVPHDQIGRAH